MVVILFLGGVQLLSIGILGEYLGRMFNETKNRPLYLVQSFDASAILGEGRLETTKPKHWEAAYRADQA
jgi:hypothetical protein